MVEHDNNLPVNREDLEKVPVMGQYIANAVELLIYQRAKPLLDVNMARVLERYFGPRQKVDIRFDSYLQTLAHDIVKHDKSKKISWAILDFAAIICQARMPKCAMCLLSDNCRFAKFVNIC
jgi:A/G-specific adenine glycosylase